MRSPIISAARCNSPTSCAISTRTPRIGRLYLPREFLVEAGITSTDPARFSRTGAPRVCAAIVALARWHFAEADKIMAQQSAPQVRAPRIMGEAYKSILEALVARGWAAPRAPCSSEAACLVSHFIFSMQLTPSLSGSDATAMNVLPQ